MNSDQPLNDSWLFWNAERLEDFPHASENDHAGAAARSDDGDDERGPGGLRLLEDFLLYVAGISAAMVGVGLAVLLGSFISAYSALNGPGAVERAGAPPQPYASRERGATHATEAPTGAILIEPGISAAAKGDELSPVGGTRPARAPSGT